MKNFLGWFMYKLIVKPTELWKPWQFFLSLCTKLLALTENELKTTYFIQSSYWIVNDPNLSIWIKSIVPNLKNQKPKKLFVKITVVFSQTFFVFFFFRVCSERIIITMLFTEFVSEFGSIILQHFTFFGFWF